MSPAGRLVRAGVAVAVGLVVLSGAGGTSASWVERVEREPGTIRSGGVTVTTGSSRVELHSRQPAGSRTYASSSGCTPDDGYTECRVITGTLSGEALIPGDRVVVTERATVTAEGDNLTGTLDVRVRDLTSGALSDFSGSATTATSIRPPSGSAVSGGTASFPVSTASDRGIGTYTVRSVVTTPPHNSGSSWGARLTGQELYDGAFSYTFTQT